MPSTVSRSQLTRRVHVALAVVVTVVGAVLLYMTLTGLEFLGADGGPGAGFFPALVSGTLVALGLGLLGVWVFGPQARNGEAPELSLQRRDLMRAGAVWATLAGFTAVLELLGFIVAGEVFVLVLLVFVERIRTWGLILALVSLPPAVYFLFATLLEVRLPGGSLWI